MTKLTVNSVDYDVDIEDDMPLLWVLRDVLKIHGPKYGCGVAQCGACTVHIQIMQAASLLNENPSPDDAAIDAAMSGNLCRCGTYPRIRAAVKSAAKALEGAYLHPLLKLTRQVSRSLRRAQIKGRARIRFRPIFWRKNWMWIR